MRAPIPLPAALLAALSLPLLPAAAWAAEQEARTDMLSPSGGLMVWTLAIFIVLLVVLTKYAFKPITAAVEAREKALEEAIEGAKRDREEAARLLADQQKAIDTARGEAQRIINEGRQTSDKMRADLLEQTRVQQHDMLERARQEIETEKEKAIAELRAEAVDLAILGAGKVIEQNLDDRKNRELVESFLGSIAGRGGH
ncbi:MAG: F0F1 ATP synthase subunit B [Gemmatimonadaceae bacterium]